MRDLNPRPSLCKRVALPTELIAHVVYLYTKKSESSNKELLHAEILFIEIEGEIPDSYDEETDRNESNGPAD
jgi:hypothetical protein